jgi:hypothetical protein
LVNDKEHGSFFSFLNVGAKAKELSEECGLFYFAIWRMVPSLGHYKETWKLGMVVHACNPITSKVEAKGSWF